MATDFYEKKLKRKNHRSTADVIVSLTTFYGGAVDGRCLQLTMTPGNYGQLTETEVMELRDQFNDWIARRNLGS